MVAQARTRAKSEKNTNLFSMFTIITLINRFRIKIQFLKTRFPFLTLTLKHQILNTVDERKMFALQKSVIYIKHS